MKALKSIINRVNRGDRPLNIVCFPTHERYEGNLAKTGHNFYSFYHPKVKKWNDAYGKAPANYHLLKEKVDQEFIERTVDFDMVLSQNKYGQIEIAKEIAKSYSLPLLSIEHTLPPPMWGKNEIANLKELKGETNVFISEYSRNQWGWKENEADVIHHGIDTSIFSNKNNSLGRESVCLSVVNEWKNRDVWCGYKFWEEATKGHPVRVFGDNPGLSNPASSIEQLAVEYNQALIFVNTSQISPIPTALLEAMACGCICISTNNCMIPEIIKNGDNGLLCDTPEQMKATIAAVLAEPSKYDYMGPNAARTIELQFSLPKFIENWNKLLYKTANIEVGI